MSGPITPLEVRELVWKILTRTQAISGCAGQLEKQKAHKKEQVTEKEKDKHE